MEEMLKAIEESKTMREAAGKLGMSFSTFKRKAVKLDVYKPNQSGKGITKLHNGNKIPLDEILEGLHPNYQSNKLKKRLIAKGILEDICSKCSLIEWNGRPITLELDHINGDNKDNRLENLRILCPNCHSQTPTFRNKCRH